MHLMHRASRRTVVLVQLPIPPLGPEPIRGNVPLAAAYLKLFAEQRGLGSYYAIDILPAPLANTLSDRALVAELAEREPWLVGFTCYLWNIERTLWIARELKRRRPQTRIVLGGPEITGDNAWVLESDAYDFAVIGEGEQTFANLLLALIDEAMPPVAIAGLYVPPSSGPRYRPERVPAFRTPLPDLNALARRISPASSTPPRSKCCCSKRRVAASSNANSATTPRATISSITCRSTMSSPDCGTLPNAERKRCFCSIRR